MVARTANASGRWRAIGQGMKILVFGHSGQVATELRALDGDVRTEVGAGDDHRHPPRHMLQTQPGQGFPFNVGEQELFRIVGDDTNAVDALVDHAIEDALLPFQIQFSGFSEGSRRDGKKCLDIPQSCCLPNGRKCLELQAIIPGC